MCRYPCGILKQTCCFAAYKNSSDLKIGYHVLLSQSCTKFLVQKRGGEKKQQKLMQDRSTVLDYLLVNSFITFRNICLQTKQMLKIC